MVCVPSQEVAMLLAVYSLGWMLTLFCDPPAEPAAVYEIQLMAFNGNGDGPANRRLASLADRGEAAAAAAAAAAGKKKP